MATAAVRGVLAAIRRSDADLLRRFAAGRDEGAFAELVRRHGPLVLGVCRRVVADRHLADDAFQAAFVVLANKAGGLDAGRPLGPWLYGVAFRVALRARLMIGRRRKRETLTASVPDVPTSSRGTGGPAAEFDLSAIVDEEIARLSAVCREAVVLCEMQGLSRKDAAARLGVAEGTLSSRLAAARKTLAARLRKRGVTLGAGLLTAALVPPELFASTVAVPTGKAELSSHLATLIHGATHMGLLSKLKLAAVATAVVLLSAGGFGVWPGNESAAAPVPKAADDAGLIWTHNAKTGELIAYTPDGTKAKGLTLTDGDRFLGLTPDGKHILFAGKKGKLADEGDTDGLTLHLRDVTDKPEGTDTGLGYQPNDQFVRSPDGSKVVRSRRTNVGPPGGAWQGQRPELAHVLFDTATRKETPIDLPADHQVMQWAADGQAWRVMQYNVGFDPTLPNYRWFTAAVGDKPKLSPVCDGGSFLWLDQHPGGKSFLGFGYQHPWADGAKPALFRVADGRAEALETFDGLAFAVVRCSPDGKRVACAKYEYDAKARTAGGTVLAVLDADGKNETKLFTVPDDGQNTRLLGWFPTKPADARKRNAPPPKAVPPEGVFLVGKMSHTKPGDILEVMDTAGKSRGHLPVGELMNVQQARVSPDGSKLAFVRFIPRSSRDKWGLYAYPQDVYVVDLPLTAPPKEPAIKGVVEPTLAWAADGKSLFVSGIPADTNLDQDGIKGQMIPKKTVRYDVAAKTEKAVDLPQWHAVLDATPDGKALLTRTHLWGGGFASSQYTNYLVPLDTLKPRVVGDENDGFAEARLSSDGTRVVGTRGDFYKTKEAGVFVADLKTNTVERVPVTDEITAAVPNGVGVVWAPDGKRLAVLWQGPAAGGRGAGAPGGGGPGRGGSVKQITVLDVDGKNAKTVREFDADDTVLRIEWAEPKLADANKPAASPDARKRNAPVPKAEPREGVIVVASASKEKPIEIVKPDGTPVKVIKPDGWSGSHLARVSRDGKRMLWTDQGSGDATVQFGIPWRIHWLDLEAEKPTAKTIVEDAYLRTAAWSADGKSVYYSRIDPANLPRRGDPFIYETWVYDVAAGKKTPLKLPPEHAVLSTSSDGKTLITRTLRFQTEEQVLHLTPLSTLRPESLGEVVTAAYSPDGKRLLWAKWPDDRDKSDVAVVFVTDLATKKETEVPLPKEVEGRVCDLCWSPDAKRIALHWHTREGFPVGRNAWSSASRVTVCDIDGSNAKTIAKREPNEDITGLDWR